MLNGILIDFEWILMDFEWILGWWIEMFVILKPIWQDTGFNQFEHVWTVSRQIMARNSKAGQNQLSPKKFWRRNVNPGLINHGVLTRGVLLQ